MLVEWCEKWMFMNWSLNQNSVIGNPPVPARTCPLCSLMRGLQPMGRPPQTKLHPNVTDPPCPVKHLPKSMFSLHWNFRYFFLSNWAFLLTQIIQNIFNMVIIFWVNIFKYKYLQVFQTILIWSIICISTNFWTISDGLLNMIYSHIFTHREVSKMLCNFKLSRHLNKIPTCGRWDKPCINSVQILLGPECVMALILFIGVMK